MEDGRQRFTLLVSYDDNNYNDNEDLNGVSSQK